MRFPNLLNKQARRSYTLPLHSTLAPAPDRSDVRPPTSVLGPLLLAVALAWLWFSLCRQLSYEWSSNEQYNYGWFVPFFAAFLFWLRWEEVGRQKEETHRENASQAGNASPLFYLLTSSFLLLLLLPIRLFEIANPDWRPLSWLHALSVVGLTLLLITYGGGRAALRRFAFPVCFILVAVPWVTPIEGPIVKELMRMVAGVATEMLRLCGIPAQLEGSLIRVSNGVVGVSEACSGVRSLQTSLMIGLLFGELKRLTVARRFLLVAAALAIALLANLARAFFLVWIAATRNLAAVASWHDLAGYTIVLAVFLGTIAIASQLTRGQRPEAGEQKAKEERLPTCDLRSLISNFRFPPLSFLLSTLALLLFCEASTSAWYRWHEHNFVATTKWTVQWPETAPGFHNLPIDDNIRSTLRYNSGREAAWRLSLTNKPNEPTLAACTMFFFRWDAGAASILRARAHRPDICLPNTGWRMTHDDGVRTYEVAPGLALPFRHFRFVHDLDGKRRIFAQAFFCQREDRVPAGGPARFDATAGRTGNWMRSDRLRVVAEGLRNQGQQVLELVMITPNETSSARAEAEFASFVPKLVKAEVRRKN